MANIFSELSSGKHLVFHMGMTGYFRYYRNEPEDLKNVRVRFSFENDYQLAFLNQRLFGMLALAENPESYIRDKGLGPDALSGITQETMPALVCQTNIKIKALSMDQHDLAGIGSVYADEILFQARIHPNTPASLLTPGKISRLTETGPPV